MKRLLQVTILSAVLMFASMGTATAGSKVDSFAAVKGLRYMHSCAESVHQHAKDFWLDGKDHERLTSTHSQRAEEIMREMTILGKSNDHIVIDTVAWQNRIKSIKDCLKRGEKIVMNWYSSKNGGDYSFGKKSHEQLQVLKAIVHGKKDGYKPDSPHYWPISHHLKKISMELGSNSERNYNVMVDHGKIIKMRAAKLKRHIRALAGTMGVRISWLQR